MNADLGSGTPEQIQAIVKDFWSAQEPILTSMQPAPDPIKADVETLLALAHQGASTGDSATFTSEDLQTADRNIDQYMLRECGYGQISITATDNAYHGIPATIGTGAVGLTLNNQGRDAHQVLIVRINDGVTEPFSTLLDLPPDQRMQSATALGSVEVDPGQVGTLFLRLTPGRYGVGDFLSQGSTSLDTPAAASRTTCSAYTPSSPSPDPHLTRIPRNWFDTGSARHGDGFTEVALLAQHPAPHRSSACWSQPNADGLVVVHVGPLVEGKRRELDRRDVCPGDPTGQRRRPSGHIIHSKVSDTSLTQSTSFRFRPHRALRLRPPRPDHLVANLVQQRIRRRQHSED